MKKVFKSWLRFLWVMSTSVGLRASAQVNRLHDLMPVPESVSSGTGRMVIDSGFRISVVGHCEPALYAYASRIVRRVGEKTGIFLDRQGFVTPADSSRNASLVIHVQRPGKLELGEDESYEISIDSSRATLTAVSSIGAMRGLETIMQLISNDSCNYFLPSVTIQDAPRFRWRGLLLDVALHFMPVDVIERTLDGMAAVKMNVLHLHLSNDQGFRVESKLFPQLQELASDGRFYTTEEVRNLIRYAGDRGIRIVPEFVVPAHTTAILTAFPQFASVKRNYSLQRYFGVFDPVLDPTNEKMWQFLDRLYGEMTALFPDQYFHIGGDENTGHDWENALQVRAYMKAHRFTKYMQVQTAFNKRLLPILRKYHKTMMGWDEILQPGVPKEIVIQSWRGNEAYYSSVREGYKAILSYGYYIDLIQPAYYHYTNDPLPDSVKLTPAQQQNILGGEATMWSELITPETVDSRIWPRTAPIAERLWSAKEIRDSADMYRRLDILSRGLEQIGLRHESYKPVMYRRLANGDDTKPVQMLIELIEPLKIYERNQGDTMYTVFSPFTKIADAAIPDQPAPRFFRQLVDSFLITRSGTLHDRLVTELREWAGNDAALRRVAAQSPILREALPLSKALGKISSLALSAVEIIRTGNKTGDEGYAAAQKELALAREQSGRCELQVVDPIEKLIRAAAGKDGNRLPSK